MRSIVVAAGAAGVLAAGVWAASAAFAEGDGFVSKGDVFVAKLTGYQEVPPISTAASGTFVAWVQGDEIAFRLTYTDLEGSVEQAHIHFGQKRVNGGVSVLLCSNLDTAPADAPACPSSPAEITGTLTAEDVIGPADQGIQPGEFDELVAAIRAGVTYVNVHSDLFPDGEIRGQLRRDWRR